VIFENSEKGTVNMGYPSQNTQRMYDPQQQLSSQLEPGLTDTRPEKPIKSSSAVVSIETLKAMSVAISIAQEISKTRQPENLRFYSDFGYRDIFTMANEELFALLDEDGYLKFLNMFETRWKLTHHLEQLLESQQKMIQMDYVIDRFYTDLGWYLLALAEARNQFKFQAEHLMKELLDSGGKIVIPMRYCYKPRMNWAVSSGIKFT
jgi:hypothetical protein